MFWFKKLTTADIQHTAKMPEVMYKYIYGSKSMQSNDGHTDSHICRSTPSFQYCF